MQSGIKDSEGAHRESAALEGSGNICKIADPLEANTDSEVPPRDPSQRRALHHCHTRQLLSLPWSLALGLLSHNKTVSIQSSYGTSGSQ